MAAILSLMTASSLATPAAATMAEDDFKDDKVKLICWVKDYNGDNGDKDEKIKLYCEVKDKNNASTD
jgi:hypothetical protein